MTRYYEQTEQSTTGTTGVWYKGEFLGRVTIINADWKGAQRWEQAARKAAYRNFPQYTEGLHVSEKGPIVGD
jgi:hypothetical protein